MKVDILPEHIVRVERTGWKTAKTHRLGEIVLENYPMFCKRWRISSDTKQIGSGGTAVALATSNKRCVKLTTSSHDARVNYFLSRHKKVAHVVKVYDVCRLDAAYSTIYAIRAERLHTRVMDGALTFFDMEYVDPWSSRWPFGLSQRGMQNLFAKAFENLGLSGARNGTLQDCGQHNVMFDHLNRPTWFDFSHYSTDNNHRVLTMDPGVATFPLWDEYAERAKLVARLQPKVQVQVAA